jgi:hypothetical protein
MVSPLAGRLVLLAHDLQPEPLLLQRTAHEAANRVRLPAGRLHHLFDRRAVGAPQQGDDDVLLRGLTVAGGRTGPRCLFGDLRRIGSCLSACAALVREGNKRCFGKLPAMMALLCGWTGAELLRLRPRARSWFAGQRRERVLQTLSRVMLAF